MGKRNVRVGIRLDGRGTFVHDHAVRKVRCHDKIVLDDERGLFCVEDEALDDLGGNDTLFRVEVGRGLVDEVDVGGLAEAEDDGHTLELTAREELDFLFFLFYFYFFGKKGVAMSFFFFLYLVEETLDLEGLDDVGLELCVDKHGLDLLHEQRADAALVLGVDLLRLVRDVEHGDVLLCVGLLVAGEDADERGLSRAVLAEHDDDLRVGELARGNLEREAAEGLLHRGVLVAAVALEVLLRLGRLGELERERNFTEAHVLGGHKAVEEDVDAFYKIMYNYSAHFSSWGKLFTLTDGKGERDNTIGTRNTIEHADKV